MVRTTRRGAIGAILSAAASAGAASADQPGHWAGVEAMARRAVADRVVPGVVFCARRGGKTLFEGGYGLANLETGTAMRPDTVCKVASVTKQFTAAAILLLAQDGHFRLGDSVAKFLPDFPRAEELTFHRLLNHTSGLGDYVQGTRAEVYKMFRTDFTSTELLDLVRKQPKLMIYQPGTSWAYSSSGYVLLGAVIEKVSGQPLGTFLQQRIFAPTGLKTTAADDTADVVPTRASGYSANPKASSGFDNAAYVSMRVPWAAGFMRSTVRDLCAWHEALIGGRVLNAESLKAMLTPARLNNGSFPKDSLLGPAIQPIRYGYGQSLRDLTGRSCVLHGGNIPGFLTDLRTYQDTGLTQAVIINVDGNPRSGKMMDEVPLAISKA